MQKNEDKVLLDRPAQGELYLTRVKEVPPEFKKATRGELVVGHSESGHHHVIRDGVTMFDAEPPDPTCCYLQVDDTLKTCAELEHVKNFEPKHGTILLEPGKTYRVKRAREMTPDGWQVAQD